MGATYTALSAVVGHGVRPTPNNRTSRVGKIPPGAQSDIMSSVQMLGGCLGFIWPKEHLIAPVVVRRVRKGP